MYKTDDLCGFSPKLPSNTNAKRPLNVVSSLKKKKKRILF